MERAGNWQELSRAIVKLLRDQFGIEEDRLTRVALLDRDLGLDMAQLEELLAAIEERFALRFPEGTLDEVLRLEDLALLASWLKGFYKRPGFLSEACARKARVLNASAGP
jgi:acyl carrier protein